jgi:RNA polymerase sigma factor (sigma-70 family)
VQYDAKEDEMKIPKVSRESLAKLEEILSRLSPLELDVLKLRYGIGDGRQYTLEEAAEKLDLTPERVEEIEIQALDKLKGPLPREGDA